MNENESKELIWVPSSVAKKFAALDGATAEEYILAAYEERRRDVQSSISRLDEDIVQFKAQGVVYKRAYMESLDVERAQLEAIFAASETELSKAREKARSHAFAVKDLLLEVRRQANEVNQALKELDAWRVTETIEKLEALSKALGSVTPKTKQVLRVILNHEHEAGKVGE